MVNRETTWDMLRQVDIFCSRFQIAEAEVLVVIVSLQSLTTLASPKFQASARNATATYSNTAGRSLAK